MLSWNDPVIKIDMEREAIETTLSPAARILDKDAEWTADCGHVHRNVPQTYRIEWGPEWFDEYEELQGGEAAYFCPLCGGPVEPKVRPGDGFRTFMPGPTHAAVLFGSGRALELTPKQIGEMDMMSTRGPAFDTLIARFALEADESQWIAGTTHQGAWG